MRLRRLIWILVGLLCLAGVWMLWQQGIQSPARGRIALRSVSNTLKTPTTSTTVSTNTAKAGAVLSNTNKFAYRLANTTKSLDQLMRDDKAILLENALIDSSQPPNLSIPANLRSQTDPGAYIVQARGPIDNAFRAMLAQAGATIVSYIPNNAYLVRAQAGVANGLASNPLTQSVTPYEPYYKISSSMPVTVGQRTFSSTSMKTNRAAGPSLLGLAMTQKPLPAGTCLTLGLFGDNAAATVAQIEKLGGQIVAQDKSPFGLIVRVIPPKNWTALVQLPGVQRVEPYHQRVRANDLSRVAVGVSTDTLTNGNYLGLNGNHVTVEVNDTGIDATHPDLSSRVFGDAVQSLVDTNGHGTHVAGIIAGSGVNSKKPPGPTDVGAMAEGSESGADFRGKAPLATLYSVGGIEGGADTNAISDYYFQRVPATNNALISNNSWNYTGNTYDLAAASYDAAVRDALPTVTGSQPVLFVFSAGNSGGGDDNGVGNPDTILSPATAKNVITVGALEQSRNITSWVTARDGTSNQVWLPMTDTSNQVARYSSRGNVGIGIEGAFGRFKPDMVAPGTFVVSTRSEQWDTNAYYNPTNYNENEFSDSVGPSGPDGINYYNDLLIPSNTVQVTIEIVPNGQSPSLLPDMTIFVWNGTDPRVAAPYLTAVGSISIVPPELSPVGRTWQYAVSNSTSQTVNYDVIVDLVATNDSGNYYDVLRTNLNDPIGPWYRYETGTSMAAADVSGVLALMQDFFTNQWHALPTPALLKAMLINGARQTRTYGFSVNSSSSENDQGWGLVNLPGALQPGITNRSTVSCSTFIQDQSPTNALATGDRQTFYVSLTDTNAQFQLLRITLAWTDPPGDPAAAIKLVNDLNLVVTNLDDPANPIVYYGNDIASGSTNNTRETTNTPPAFDSINNVENVYITPYFSTNYSVTVVGYRVNVNAVTAQTNTYAVNGPPGTYAPNVVQDYALVISSGDGQITNAMTVTANPIVSNPTGDQQITYLSGNSGELLNQTVGANTPLMGTNTLLLTNSIIVSGETNLQITIGMTNQWHFYVVTNNTGFTNAAFVTFIPDTLSIPRMGVFEDTVANATRPQADIDVYVASGPNAWGLTNLDPVVINSTATNYLASVSGPSPNVFATTAGGIFEMASLSRGGSEYVVDTNSQLGEVYYVGVKSEDQMASEYAFWSVFSATPFSQINGNGSQTVNGFVVPANITDGSPAIPGFAHVGGIAIYPIDVHRVVVTNQVWHQNFGDLMGTLTLNGGYLDVLNNHNSLGNTYETHPAPFVYDDSGQGDIIGSQPSDGPGSLNGFIGQQGNGLWMLTESDDSLTQTGTVESFNLMIEPHKDLNQGITVTVQPGKWYYDYIDVPSGATNLTINATNLTGATPPLQLYVKFGAEPTLTDYDKTVGLTNSGPLGLNGSISIGPTDVPPLTVGRYFIGIFNLSLTPQTVHIIAVPGFGAVPGQVDYTSTGATPILDDAVTYSTISVPDNATISSVDVGLRVDHPRISDLVFHLISPDGTRVLLMENRGGTSTNGAGGTYNISNIVFSASGGPETSTNSIDTGQTSGTLKINYDFRSTNELAVYDQSWNFIWDSGRISGVGVFPVPYVNSSKLFVVMNPSLPGGSSGYTWDFTINITQARYAYLVLTENTNRTITPIKFAPPPFISVTNAAPPIPHGVDVLGGPLLNPGNGHAYYLLDTETWTHSESDAVKLSGHLATITDATNNSWVYGTFSYYGGVSRSLWIGLYDPTQDTGCSATVCDYGDPCHSNNFVWVSGESVTPASYKNWSARQPDNCSHEYYAMIPGWGTNSPSALGYWNDTGPDWNTYQLTYGVVEVTNFNLSTISPDLYYLPEQSLDAFAGKNAGGTWTLEIQDARTGAYLNLNPQLMGWQLRFTFVNSTPLPTVLNTNSAFTNFIAPGGMAYYWIKVPDSANWATNILFSATEPLNLWFNSTNLPIGVTPPDSLLLGDSTGGIDPLGAVGTTPSLPPAPPDRRFYYLGVQNTNSVTASYGLEVDFDDASVPWTSAFSVSSAAAAAASSGVQLQWTAPPGDSFQVEWATNISPPIVWTTNADIITSADGIFTFTDPGSTNSPARFYRLIQLQ